MKNEGSRRNKKKTRVLGKEGQLCPSEVKETTNPKIMILKLYSVQRKFSRAWELIIDTTHCIVFYF